LEKKVKFEKLVVDWEKTSELNAYTSIIQKKKEKKISIFLTTC